MTAPDGKAPLDLDAIEARANNFDGNDPDPRCIDDLFALVARVRELEALANQRLSRLIDHGILPEELRPMDGAK